jgi:hypothetical protein
LKDLELDLNALRNDLFKGVKDLLDKGLQVRIRSSAVLSRKEREKRRKENELEVSLPLQSASATHSSPRQ